MASPRIARVLALDDHPLQLEIVCAVLSKVFGTAEVRAFGSLDEALRDCAEAGAPDLMVLDLGLPDCSGIEALTRFREACPQTAVVVYSASEDGVIVRAALNAGAMGYIPKRTAKELMQAALRLVADGGVYVPPAWQMGV